MTIEERIKITERIVNAGTATGYEMSLAILANQLKIMEVLKFISANTNIIPKFPPPYPREQP